MEFTGIKLKNILNFENSGWIEIKDASISLLTGENNTGKSNIIKVLRLLKRIHERTEFKCNNLHEYVRSNQEYDVGNKKEKKISISFKFDMYENFYEIVRKEFNFNIEDTEHEIEIELVFIFKDRIKLVLQKFQIKRGSVPVVDAKNDIDGWSIYKRRNGRYKYELGVMDNTIFPSIICYDEKMKGDIKIKELINSMKRSVDSFLDRMECDKIKIENQNMIEIKNNIFKKQTAWDKFISGKTKKEENTEIEYWIRKLGLGEKLILTTYPYGINGLIPTIEIDGINIKNCSTNTERALKIIVKSVLSEINSTVIIENPELGLTERVQAEMADLFIKYSSSGTAFLIETHSESLIARLLRRIAERTAGIHDKNKNMILSRNELNIHFLKDGKANLLNVRNHGDIENTEEAEEFKEMFKKENTVENWLKYITVNT